jgi:hypothetical protein
VETLEQVRQQEPLPVRQFSPKAPRDLEAICLKCLEKEPSRRYESALELAADLQRFVRDDSTDPVRARLPGLTEQAFRALLRQQFQNVTPWGRILVSTATINAIAYLASAWLILSEKSPEILISSMVLHSLLIAGVYWTFLRGARLKSGDRIGVAFALATIVGTNLIPVFYRPAAGMDLTG